MADPYRQIFLYMLLYEYDPQRKYALDLFLLVKDKPTFCSFSYGHSLGRDFLATLIDNSVVSPALDDDFKMVDVPLTEEEFEKMYDEKFPSK